MSDNGSIPDTPIIDIDETFRYLNARIPILVPDADDLREVAFGAEHHYKRMQQAIRSPVPATATPAQKARAETFHSTLDRFSNELIEAIGCMLVNEVMLLHEQGIRQWTVAALRERDVDENISCSLRLESVRLLVAGNKDIAEACLVGEHLDVYVAAPESFLWDRKMLRASGKSLMTGNELGGEKMGNGSGGVDEMPEKDDSGNEMSWETQSRPDGRDHDDYTGTSSGNGDLQRKLGQQFRQGKERAQNQDVTSGPSGSASNLTAGDQAPSDDEQPEDVHCSCRGPSHGNMICCENATCEVGWYHWACVKLKKEPKSRWLCSECKKIPRRQIVWIEE